jgi:hypothetical protein
MIIVIRTSDGQKYWTSKYTEDQGFIVFDSEAKDGTLRKVSINKSQIIEISEMDKEFPSKKK